MQYIVYRGKLDIRLGGPSGYLENLKIGIEGKDNNVKFLVICDSTNNNINKRELKSKIKKMLISLNPILGEKVIENINDKILFKNGLKFMENLIDIDINKKNNLFHFHTAIDFYNGYERVNKAKTILTTHNPECFSIEYINSIKCNYKKEYSFKKLKNKIIKAQIFAYQNADYLIFPSKESLEPYINTIDGFSEIIKNKKVYYNLTGCKKLEYKLTREEFRKKYNISNDKFVVSYIGRKNKVKGYDIFIKLFNEVCRDNENIIFLTAGAGEIESPNSKQFIDLGWTDDPGSLINASDIFILPNRMTYFDLIALEVMSLGKPIIASNTGGNITLSQISSGVSLFESENIRDLKEKLLSIYNNKIVLNEMSKMNLDAYEKYFTIDKFAQRYLNILEVIKNEEIE